MDRALIIGVTGVRTLEGGCLTISMGMGSISGLMAAAMKGLGRITSYMDAVLTSGLMAGGTKENI
jgi:hypothetical protein